MRFHQGWFDAMDIAFGSLLMKPRTTIDFFGAPSLVRNTISIEVVHNVLLFMLLAGYLQVQTNEYAQELRLVGRQGVLMFFRQLQTFHPQRNGVFELSTLVQIICASLQ
jgi:hypothetical protein